LSKFFIDCGGYNGCSVTYFRKKYDIDGEYFVHSFEPNEIFFNNYNFSNHTLHKKAVWIANGVYPFYLDKADGDGSSLLSKKTTGNLDFKNPIYVECIDLSEWIINSFNIKDEIILKLDVEGAEYEILNKMINDNSLNFISELYVEWHWKKIGMSAEDHNNFISNIKIPITGWDAQLDYLISLRDLKDLGVKNG